MRALITTDTVGGVWRFTQELATGLLETGDAVALLSFGQFPSAAQRAECEQLASRWGKAFRYIPSDLPLEWMQNNERCFSDGSAIIARLAEQFAPDFIHSNQFCFGAVELGTPKVVTAHSDVLSWARTCLSSAVEEKPWLARYCEMVQRGLNGANAVTVPTRWMLRALGEGFKLRGEACVIPNGRMVAPAPAGPRRPQAVTAGRLWDEAKDVALLEQVCSPIPLIIAGATECNGSEAASLHGISLMGALADCDLMKLFRESAIYICTSRYEPFGLSPLEAALCGCAVLARKIDSLIEVWGDAALYFHDADNLSELLAWLDEDRESLRIAQRRAYTRAREYSREAMVMAYRALYHAVMEMAGVSYVARRVLGSFTPLRLE